MNRSRPVSAAMFVGAAALATTLFAGCGSSSKSSTPTTVASHSTTGGTSNGSGSSSSTDTSGSSTTVETVPPGAKMRTVGGTSSLPTPGFGSPAAAMSGFLKAVQSSKPADACLYVPPAGQQLCTTGITQSGSNITVTGAALGITSIVGDRAIVTVLGHLCSGAGSAKTCFDSSDAKGGQPTSVSNFDQAYQASIGGNSSANNPAAPLIQISGKWYLDLGT